MKYILAFMMTLSYLHAQELTAQEEKKEEFLFDLQLNSLYKQKRVDITEDLNQKNFGRKPQPVFHSYALL
jgi:hypothetical protein